MRRLMPMWSSVVAILLLLQWAGVMPACLSHVAAATPAILCHVDDAQDTSDHSAPGHHASPCPLCAPLPPIILANLPVSVPPPSLTFHTAMHAAPAPRAPVPTRPSLQQPRAPPVLS